MKKKTKMVILLLFCIFAIIGCIFATIKMKEKRGKSDSIKDINFNSDIEHENTVANTTDLTLEYVCNEFGISESQFDGVDFDEFVEYYGLTYENIHRESVEYLLNEYKKNNGETEFYDYKYMTNPNDGLVLTADNQNDVKTLYCSQVEGDLKSFWVFDLEKNIMIADTGAEQVIHKDKIVANLSDKDKENILNLFSKYEVYSWYENKENLSSGEWYLSVEFKDGTIAGVSGSNVDENTDFDGLLDELKEMAKEG